MIYNIDIEVKSKIARQTNDTIPVCDNKDYTVIFDFDEEWADFPEKTARFCFNGSFVDVDFTGTSCPMPPLHNVFAVEIGVYVGDLHTTTPAEIRVLPSILNVGEPFEPTPDVYEQLIKRIKGVSGKIGDLKDLATEEKSNLVEALNEAFCKRAFFVEYGMYSNFDQLQEAVDSFQPVFCIRADGDAVGIYRVVESGGGPIIFERPHSVGSYYCIAEQDEKGDITWSWQADNPVSYANPETKGNAYFTANGTHVGNAKYIGVLFNNDEVENAVDAAALADNSEDPRLKLHGGTRNIDLMASTNAEDQKNVLQLLGDNKKNNTYLTGLLPPREGCPNDAVNKQYADDLTIIFNATLPHDGWETIGAEDEDADPTYEQTIEVPAIAGIKASDHVALQLCPRPDSIAAWNNYGIVCVEAAGGNGEGPGMLRFTAHRRPATNETIYINAILVR